MALTSPLEPDALQPRYRRLLGVGALLDESIRQYREHWRTFVATSVVALLPLGLINIGAGVLGATVATQPAFTAALITGTRPEQFIAGAIGALVVFIIVASLDGLLWTAAVTSASDAYLHARRPTLRASYGVAVRRLLTLLGAGVLLALALIGLGLVASLLFVVTLFGILGGLAALAGLLVWWLNPPARRPWLKWLIVLTAPGGLPVYMGVRWSLFIPAAILERHGARAALARSSQLMQGEWFRAATVLGAAGLIVGVLVSAPSYLVSIPLSIVSAARGDPTTSAVQAAISSAVSVVCQILFASITSITATLLFVDLRNRREGTDLAERVRQLEADVPPR